MPAFVSAFLESHPTESNLDVSGNSPPTPVPDLKPGIENLTSLAKPQGKFVRVSDAWLIASGREESQNTRNFKVEALSTPAVLNSGSRHF